MVLNGIFVGKRYSGLILIQKVYHDLIHIPGLADCYCNKEISLCGEKMSSTTFRRKTTACTPVELTRRVW